MGAVRRVGAESPRLYESQIGSPGGQNCDFGAENGDVWPISQTNAFGVSLTIPHFSELLRSVPIVCVEYVGRSGPLALFRTIVPESPVFLSWTSMCHPPRAS